MSELIAVAAVAIVAWFAAGTIWNIRKGRELMRWMQGGLPVLGERTTVRWLGSSAVELVIRDGKAPFSAATLVVFLEARDLPWMWLLGRSRGRRDTLIFRAVLRRTSGIEFEALEPSSWSGSEALPRVPSDWPVGRAFGGLTVHHATADALARAEALLGQAGRAGLRVRRLALRRAEPNFQLHVAFPDQRQPAHDFFEVVRNLAERAGD